MITYSDTLEAKQHLMNALHHAGLAVKLMALPEIIEAIGHLEAALAKAEEANGAERRAFDDTVEV